LTNSYRFRQEALEVVAGQVGEHVHYLIRDRHGGRAHRLYELEYRVAVLLDGKRDVHEIAEAARALGFSPSAEDVDRFALQLFALGFVERKEEEQ
jgi:hypothetical protein